MSRLDIIRAERRVESVDRGEAGRTAGAYVNALIETAEALRPLLGELLFVGGCVTSLLITDEGPALRARHSTWTRALGFSDDFNPGRTCLSLGSSEDDTRRNAAR